MTAPLTLAVWLHKRNQTNGSCSKLCAWMPRVTCKVTENGAASPKRSKISECLFGNFVRYVRPHRNSRYTRRSRTYVRKATFCSNECLIADPRKVNQFCMMLKETLMCDKSAHPKMPSVDEINEHLADEDCRNSLVIYVNDSCLTGIKASDLREFHRVKTLSLSGNRITKLHSFTFAGNKQLESLEVCRNKIGEVERKAFEGLHKLRHLNLAHNDIEKLEVGTLDRTENLESLNLDGNLISAIEQRLLRKLWKLKILQMRGNRISKIRDHVFHRKSVLTHLHLDSNEIHSLTRYAFRHLEKLEVLTISHNRLQEWPASYGRILVNLHTLDLGSNMIFEFTSAHVENMSELQNLSLEKNSLEQVDEDVFTTTLRLEYLNLAENFLKDIPIDTFGGLCYLKHLLLHKNKLEIPRKQWLKSLGQNGTTVHVDLKQNYWNCDCRAKEYWAFLQRFESGSSFSVQLDTQCTSPKRHSKRALSELSSDDFENCPKTKEKSVEATKATSTCVHPYFEKQLNSTPQPFRKTSREATTPSVGDKTPALLFILIATMGFCIFRFVYYVYRYRKSERKRV